MNKGRLSDKVETSYSHPSGSVIDIREDNTDTLHKYLGQVLLVVFFCHLFFMRFFIFLQNKTSYKLIHILIMVVFFCFCYVVFFLPENNYFHIGSIEEVLTKIWKNKDSLIQSRSCLQKNYQKLSLTSVKKGLKRNYHGLVLKNTKQVFPIPRWKSVLLVSSSENNYQKFLACSMDADFNRRKHTAYMYMAIAIIIFTKCNIIQKPIKEALLQTCAVWDENIMIFPSDYFSSINFLLPHFYIFQCRAYFLVLLLYHPAPKKNLLTGQNAFQLSAFPRAGFTALPEKYTL